MTAADVKALLVQHADARGIHVSSERFTEILDLGQAVRALRKDLQRLDAALGELSGERKHEVFEQDREAATRVLGDYRMAAWRLLDECFDGNGHTKAPPRELVRATWEIIRD